MTVHEKQIWSEVTKEFGRLRGRQVRDLWFEDAKPCSFRRGLFTLDVKDASKKEAIDSCYRKDIESIFHSITGSPVRLRTRVAEEVPVPVSTGGVERDGDGTTTAGARGEDSVDVGGRSKKKPRKRAGARPRDPIALTGPLEFVQTEVNELAFGAMSKFVEEADTGFNSLFVHAPAGCGKTALARHAIRSMLSEDESCDPLVLSGESLGRDVARATRARTFGAIQRVWAAHDTIVLDEAHRLRGQRVAQTVAVSLIGPVLARGGRVLVLSRHAPGQIHGLGDRLRSHFESGLVVSMQQPDGNHRLAVLNSVAAGLPASVDEAAVSAVSERCPGTLTDAVGLLEDASAVARDERRSVCLEDVEAQLVRVGRGVGSITLLIEILCDETGICPNRLRSSEKSRDVAVMRHLCVYLASYSLGLSSRHICRSLRLKSPSIVAYARRAVERRRSTDSSFEQLIYTLQARLAGAQRDFEW
ncbi:MAG: DnaA/Hda family protein [Planctomycetota bacterium]|nr:DnaA/Hda family protein [Planctomycetota bacterium]